MLLLQQTPVHSWCGCEVQFWTELSLVILMVGTLITGIQQFGEAIAAGIGFINPDYTGVFVQGSGRLNMAIGVLCVCVPLVFIAGLRQVRLNSHHLQTIYLDASVVFQGRPLDVLTSTFACLQLEYAGDVGFFINQVLRSSTCIFARTLSCCGNECRLARHAAV